MIEQRLTVRLIKYWNKLKKDQYLPNFDSWNPSSIDDLWDNCLVMIAQPHNGDDAVFKYNYVGEKVSGVWGKNIVGKEASKKASKIFRGAGIVKNIQEVNDNGEISLDDGKFINEKNKMIKYRSCLLPFGSEKDGVSHIVIGLSWREFG